MNPDIRRKALLAASSVVLALGSGCDPVSPRDPQSVVVAPAPTGDTGDLLAGAEPDCTTTTDMGTCCAERTTWCEAQGLDDASTLDCIYGPGFDGSTGCIPWGPPVPPRFTGRRVA